MSNGVQVYLTVEKPFKSKTVIYTVRLNVFVEKSSTLAVVLNHILLVHVECGSSGKTNSRALDQINELKVQIIDFSSLIDDLCKQLYEFIDNELLQHQDGRHVHIIAPYRSNGAEKAVELDHCEDAGSETRPPMLERGSYIPWASHFRRYLNRKRENRKWLNKAIDEGPYEFRIFTPSETEAPRMQKEEDLRGDDLKHYEAEIEEMNLILISIPNDIYNSLDACTTRKAMCQRVECLMQGIVQNKVDRETRFNNEFDQFVTEPRQALVSIYNRFAQLMNDLERNGIIFPKVTINTKFLNCLQPEWLKYVTQVRLAKRLTEDSYDDLFDYLQQFKKLVNASRAKKLEKSHDPLALVAHTGSSSRTTTPYYVTHPSSVVDYDDDYQGDVVQNNSEDPLTSAMILLARAITQRFFNPTNNRLRTSSNTKNQAIVQRDRVNIQSKNYGNDGRNIIRSYVHEEIIEGNNVQNDAGNPQVPDSKYFMEQMLLAKQDEAGLILTDEQNDFLFTDASRMEEVEELSANICLMARIQPANFDSDEGPIYDSAFLSEVQTPSTSYVNPLFAKDTQEQNGCVEYNNNVQESYALEQLARNAYKEAEKQQIIAKKVQQQNTMLTKQLESYKEKVRGFERTKGNNTTYFNEYIEADRKAKRFEQESQSQFIRDRDTIRDLEQQRLRAISSVRRPSHRDSSFKNSVLSNTKNSSAKVEVSDRTNKKLDVASKNVDSNKKIVTNDDIKNALIAKNVLLKSQFEDTTLVVSKTRFSIKTVQSKSLDTTPVGSKTRIAAVTPLSAKHKAMEIMYKVTSLCVMYIYVRNLEGDDLLTGDRESNLYNISISDMAASSPVCLMSKATSTKSWLWHRRLSHLNFDTINDLTKHDLVDGLLKFKYRKDHLCSACERGKSKKASHLPKLVPSNHSKLELLHMGLCRPMRVASINRKRYILVIVDDYSQFTWVYFLRTKDETS
ncbi:integrase, catalytic region, zinc finger, CCHC-type containing protein [Tanacetum coccineum]